MAALTEKTDLPPVGLPRRLGAILYDALVVLGIVFAAALPLPLLDGLAGGALWALWLKRLYLLLVVFIYFGGFWSHGGQTVGMKAWRIKLVADDGGLITWRHALIRFLGAMVSALSLGLGFLWALAKKDRSTWHDRLSSTHLHRMPAPLRTKSPGKTKS